MVQRPDGAKVAAVDDEIESMFDARMRQLATDRNEGREPDELHLAYERELWELRARLNWVLAEADDELRERYRRLGHGRPRRYDDPHRLT
jgi:hypothetical protein